MRKYSVTQEGQDWIFEYPDNVVFAFNPLYVVVKTAPVNVSLTMEVVSNGRTRSIQVQVFNGSARIFFSRILQLFFEDYKHFRTLSFTVSLLRDNITLFSTTFMAIWGTLPLGGRYNAYGLFSLSGKTSFERTRIWFRNYPFKVSMFSVNANPPIVCSADGKVVAYQSLPELPAGAPTDPDGEWVDADGNLYQYDASAKEYYTEDVGNGRELGIFDITPSWLFPDAKESATIRIGELGTANVFDETFDYTFYQRGLSTHIIHLKVSNEKSGYYLRWIDSLGELQYFLFANKVVTQKNTLSADTISDMEKVGPMCYPDHVRHTQITSVRTCNCCAVSLPREIYEYVCSIVTAPIVDLYLGRAPSGREIWVPVNIVAASYDYDTTKPLNDLTLAFTLPEYKSQTL